MKRRKNPKANSYLVAYLPDRVLATFHTYYIIDPHNHPAQGGYLNNATHMKKKALRRLKSFCLELQKLITGLHLSDFRSDLFVYLNYSNIDS